MDETKPFRFIREHVSPRAHRAGLHPRLLPRPEDTTMIVARAHRTSRPRVVGEREAEILDATLSLLADSGYDRLTMDAVAAAAKASKATLYRRWSTKAELVVDAIIQAKGTLQVGHSDRGSLREDLIAISCHRGGLNDERSLAVMASLITALHRDQEFHEAFLERFVRPRLEETMLVYRRAMARGEIRPDVDLELLGTVLPAVVLHRAFVLGEPVDDDVVVRIIDEIVLPAATPTTPEPTTDKDS
jgi:AcrR family transcriptional regulator